MQDRPLSPLMMQVTGTRSAKLPFFAAVVIVNHTLTIAKNGEHTHETNTFASKVVCKKVVCVCVCVCGGGEGGVGIFRRVRYTRYTHSYFTLVSCCILV